MQAELRERMQRGRQSVERNQHPQGDTDHDQPPDQTVLALAGIGTAPDELGQTADEAVRDVVGRQGSTLFDQQGKDERDESHDDT